MHIFLFKIVVNSLWSGSSERYAEIISLYVNKSRAVPNNFRHERFKG